MDRALDEAIPGASMDELAAHLARCPGCRRQWEALRAAEAVLRVPRPVQAPDDLLADFRRRLAAEQPVAPRAPARPWLSWLWPTGSLAAAGLAAALAVTFNLTGSFDAPPAPQREARSMARSQGSPGSPAIPAPVVPTPTPKPADLAPETTLRPAPAAKGRPFGRKAPRSDFRSGVEGETRLSDRPSTGTRANQANKAPAAMRDLEVRLFVGPAQNTPRANDPMALAKESKGVAAEKTTSALDPSSRERSTSNYRLQAATPGSSPRMAAGTRGASADARELRRDKKPLPDGSPENGERLTPAAQPESGNGPAGGTATSSRYLALADFGNTASYYFQDVDKLQPNELEVSPAVLTALQRPVEVTLKGKTIAGAMRQLTEAADVVLSVDPRVASVTVTVETPGTQAPLWVVLQEVAQQSNLQIIPQENRLELRPAGKEADKPAAGLSLGISANAPAAPSPASPTPRGVSPGTPPPASVRAGLEGVRRFRNEPERPAKALKGRSEGDRPATPSGPRAKKEPSDLRLTEKLPTNQATLAGAAPDRRVWPDQWGRLPEWGFLLPGPEGLPTEAPAEARKAAGPAAAKPGTQPRNKVKRGERK